MSALFSRAFVSQFWFKGPLCASLRSHVTILKQLQTIVVCLTFTTGTPVDVLCWDDVGQSEAPEEDKNDRCMGV